MFPIRTYQVDCRSPLNSFCSVTPGEPRNNQKYQTLITQISHSNQQNKISNGDHAAVRTRGLSMSQQTPPPLLTGRSAIPCQEVYHVNYYLTNSEQGHRNSSGQRFPFSLIAHSSIHAIGISKTLKHRKFKEKFISLMVLWMCFCTFFVERWLWCASLCFSGWRKPRRLPSAFPLGTNLLQMINVGRWGCGG